MVVAEPHTQPRIKFWSPDAGRLAYKTWDEMSAKEQTFLREKHPELLPRTELVADADERYGDIRLEFEEQLARYTALRREGSKRDRMVASWAITEYTLALELLKEAETIPEGTDAQFAYAPGGEQFQTRLPPRHDESDRTFDTLIQFHQHVYRTDKPIRIAWLRRMIRLGGDPNLREVKIGEYPAIAKETGALIAFVPYEAYANGVDNGSFAR